jgi:hypothetical protein
MMKLALTFFLAALYGWGFTFESTVLSRPPVEVLLSDTVGPVIKLTVTSRYTNSFHLQSDSSILSGRTIFLNGSILSITAHNRVNGTTEVYITFDQAPEKKYEEPIKLAGKGRHAVRVRAVDSAGNESILKFDYEIVADQ